MITNLLSCGSNDDIANDCSTNEKAIIAAEEAYNLDKQNEALCENYKTALQKEITICGDTDGILQAKIEALGDCKITNSGKLSVTVGTLKIEFTTISVILTSGLITVNASKQGQGSDYYIYFELAENSTGVAIMQNFKITLLDKDFFPNTDGFDDFTNTITVNSTGTIKGTFSGMVTRADGADLSLSGGIIDVKY